MRTEGGPPPLLDGPLPIRNPPLSATEPAERFPCEGKPRWRTCGAGGSTQCRDPDASGARLGGKLRPSCAVLAASGSQPGATVEAPWAAPPPRGPTLGPRSASLSPGCCQQVWALVLRHLRPIRSARTIPPPAGARGLATASGGRKRRMAMQSVLQAELARPTERKRGHLGKSDKLLPTLSDGPIERPRLLAIRQCATEQSASLAAPPPDANVPAFLKTIASGSVMTSGSAEIPHQDAHARCGKAFGSSRRANTFKCTAPAGLASLTTTLAKEARPSASRNDDDGDDAQTRMHDMHVAFRGAQRKQQQGAMGPRSLSTTLSAPSVPSKMLRHQHAPRRATESRRDLDLPTPPSLGPPRVKARGKVRNRRRAGGRLDGCTRHEHMCCSCPMSATKFCCRCHNLRHVSPVAADLVRRSHLTSLSSAGRHCRIRLGTPCRCPEGPLRALMDTHQPHRLGAWLRHSWASSAAVASGHQGRQTHNDARSVLRLGVNDRSLPDGGNEHLYRC